MHTIVPIVEGHGDVDALPDLMRRIIWEKFNRYDVIVAPRKGGVISANGRSNLESNPEKFLRYALNNPGCDAILIVLDADDDCPVDLARRLLQRCEGLHRGLPLQIVCARPEYEAWFLASLDTIRGKGVIPENTNFNGDPEEVRDPKRWLTDRMAQGRAYKETDHQASFSSHIDIELAHHNSRSFRRLCHALEQLVGGIPS